MTVPSLSTARAAPGPRGALPPTATTVATANARPSSVQRCRSPARSSMDACHQDTVGADRQVPVAYAGRVPDRVGDGRGGAHDADLADALDADRVVGVRVVDPVRLHGRGVGVGGDVIAREIGAVVGARGPGAGGFPLAGP